jgi:hypothetical protein
MLKMKKITVLLLVLFFLASGSNDAVAWVFPEHRKIALLAIQKLNAEQRALFEQLWAEARRGYEGRLTLSVIDTTQSLAPTQLDFASWPAIAGDHSCSPKDMLQSVLQSKWILKVADVAARLEVNLKRSKNDGWYTNAIRDSDIRLQRSDVDYATRAGSNNVHFLLARHEVELALEKYMADCLMKGAPLNAVAAYTWFHHSALAKAQRYSDGNLSSAQRYEVILASLADEAFALHFLEDAFAAGHIVGTWGNASLRKGTHDHYNERGVEVQTWEGKKMIAKGDAYLRELDAEVAAAAVQRSLMQLISAANGKLPIEPEEIFLDSTIGPDTLDVCKNNFLPSRTLTRELVREVLLKTPIPGLATGEGELPRFRAELGLFAGVSTSLNGSSVSGGFGTVQNKGGGIGGLEANAMIGYGLDGVLNQSGDGLIFLQVGWRQDAPSSHQFINQDPTSPATSITSVIPGRSAYNIRLRLPFWLLPGDLLVAGPILALVSPKALQRMAVGAVNGGAIPWQSGIRTGIGRFQFILGREFGVSLYGIGSTTDALFVPDAAGDLYILSYKSAKFDFPVFEYRPVRSFSQDQSSILKVQFSFGVDVPYQVRTVAPVGRAPIELQSVWHITARVLFNWRHYF